VLDRATAIATAHPADGMTDVPLLRLRAVRSRSRKCWSMPGQRGRSAGNRADLFGRATYHCQRTDYFHCFLPV